MTFENASLMTTAGCKKALFVAFSTVSGAGALAMKEHRNDPDAEQIYQLEEQLAALVKLGKEEDIDKMVELDVKIQAWGKKHLSVPNANEQAADIADADTDTDALLHTLNDIGDLIDGPFSEKFRNQLPGNNTSQELVQMSTRSSEEELKTGEEGDILSNKEKECIQDKLKKQVARQEVQLNGQKPIDLTRKALIKEELKICQRQEDLKNKCGERGTATVFKPQKWTAAKVEEQKAKEEASDEDNGGFMIEEASNESDDDFDMEVAHN